MKEKKNTYTGRRRRRRGSFLSPLISITLVLFLMGLFSILILYAGRLKTYLKENVEVSLYFNEDTKEADIIRLQKMLDNEPFVKNTDFVDKQEALELMTKDLGPDAINVLDFNPFPASLDVFFKSDYACVDSIEQFKNNVEKYDFIKEVAYQRVFLETIDKNVRIGGMVILGFMVVFLFIAMILINNTVRLMLYSQRFLIKTKQLVGATESFIILPYVRLAMIFGLLGGIIAALLLGVLVYLLNTQFLIGIFSMAILPYSVLGDITANAILLGVILVFGILITGLSSFFSVKRYLKLKLDDLY